MKKLKVLALALVCAVFSPAKADEGMWLLQLMQEQNLADRMKAQGLKMDIMDIYNPDQITLRMLSEFSDADVQVKLSHPTD